MIDIFTIILIILVVFAILMPVVFFREHNRNLKKMKAFSEKLEKILEPKDKEYTLLGTSVGFRAIYKIEKNNIDKIEAVLILLPRQSVIYYPIAKITTKYDRFIFKVEFQKSLSILPSTFEKKRKFCSEHFRKNINGISYIACGMDVDKLERMIENAGFKEKIIRMSYENRVLFIEFSSSDPELLDSVNTILGNAKLYF